MRIVPGVRSGDDPLGARIAQRDRPALRVDGRDDEPRRVLRSRRFCSGFTSITTAAPTTIDASHAVPAKREADVLR